MNQADERESSEEEEDSIAVIAKDVAAKDNKDNQVLPESNEIVDEL